MLMAKSAKHMKPPCAWRLSFLIADTVAISQKVEF